MKRTAIKIITVLLLTFSLCSISTKNSEAASLSGSLSTSETYALVNDTIKLTAKGTGKSSYKYKFRYKIGKGKLHTIKNYSKTASYSYKVKKSGTYTFYVYIKSGKKVVKKTKKVYVKNMSVSLSITGNLVGHTVKLKATSSNSFNSKRTYQYSYILNGEETILKEYSSSSSITFTPEVYGKYTFKVSMKNGGKTVTKTSKRTIKEFVLDEETNETVLEAGMSEKELEARIKVVDTALSWVGTKEGSSNHKKILSIYNSYKKNYTNGHINATVSTAWCDIFTSVVFIQCGYDSISGVECGCERHIALLKKLGSYVEDDSYVPSPGDIIFYDWQDSGKGDCSGHSEHIGIISSVSEDGMVTIEGNYSDQVKKRTVNLNSRYIRGYGVPDYESL